MVGIATIVTVLYVHQLSCTDFYVIEPGVSPGEIGVVFMKVFSVKIPKPDKCLVLNASLHSLSRLLFFRVITIFGSLLFDQEPR